MDGRSGKPVMEIVQLSRAEVATAVASDEPDNSPRREAARKAAVEYDTYCCL